MPDGGAGEVGRYVDLEDGRDEAGQKGEECWRPFAGCMIKHHGWD